METISIYSNENSSSQSLTKRLKSKHFFRFWDDGYQRWRPTFTRVVGLYHSSAKAGRRTFVLIHCLWAVRFFLQLLDLKFCIFYLFVLSQGGCPCLRMYLNSLGSQNCHSRDKKVFLSWYKLFLLLKEVASFLLFFHGPRACANK